MRWPHDRRPTRAPHGFRISDAALERLTEVRLALLDAGPMPPAELRKLCPEMSRADYDSAIKRLLGARHAIFTGSDAWPGRGCLLLTWVGWEIANREADAA